MSENNKENNFVKFMNEVISKKWKENIDELKKEIIEEKYSKALIRKIQNECNRKGYPYDKILEKIKDDEMYASFFAKNPMKQSLFEEQQLFFLKKICEKVSKLPTSGNNSIYLENGKLIKGRTKGLSTKSLDFFDSEANIYFYAKYTNEEGGSQDNQFVDCKIFIHEANEYCKNNLDNIKFFALLDGMYFNEKRRKILSDLISETNVDRVQIISTKM